ncbi:MAG: PTS sugar transporter subunit IIA [Chlamydiia bacterium]|nr:PTS sugar transporter subunit IIA [Chlamydiia bacterium]
MKRISHYLDPKLVAFLDVDTRDEALYAMVDLLNTHGKIQGRDTFYEAILDREKIVSTGIGMAVAIPHAKLPTYDDFFIAVGILKRGVEWNAMDGSPVRLIFMIGGPDDKQTEYLQILSALTTAIKDEDRRKKILSLDSPEAIIKQFEKF